MNSRKELKPLYTANREAISRRDARFARFMACSSERRTFAELAFCLLTPQSNALNCWEAVRDMRRNRVLFEGGALEISDYIACARFRNKKAEYIVRARDLFSGSGHISIKKHIEGFETPVSGREWLVKNIKGMGWKEASHFLRNVGRGKGLAILDRHILKNLESMGVIARVPGSLTGKAYLETEDKMKKFAEDAGIPLNHLDLLLWFRETGKIFK